MSGRTLVMGDPHGALRAVRQVLERAAFDPAADRLIVLGDVCDGWPEVDRLLDVLLEVPRLILLSGNHDRWALPWMRDGVVDLAWIQQGGLATLDAYARRADRDPPADWREARLLARTVPEAHWRLLDSAHPYWIEEDGRTSRLFVHAGWRPGVSRYEQDDHTLLWSRDLFDRATTEEGPPLTAFDEVFIGHSVTKWAEPRKCRGVWALDQGAGWDGRLTLFELGRDRWVQSDPVPTLYPDEAGRMGG